VIIRSRALKASPSGNSPLPKLYVTRDWLGGM